MKKILLLSTLLAAIGLSIYVIRPFSSKIDFNTQVKPILNKRCITCHGGVKQSGELSMMTREDLLKAGESGRIAVVPGDPDGSEFYRRLVTQDEVERMPFETEALPKEEIKILHQWIKEGAEWGKHWAYKTVEQVKIPQAKTLLGSTGNSKESWANNTIDHFILEKLKEQKLSPSTRADKNILLRRLGLDLIGMPASEQLSNLYLSDQISYEQLVDSLLNSPRFGERWASVWMDLARYADTKGSERDSRRTIWEYRDWLIRAFNQDMPYDQFLTEQIAGDLLPNPTDAQYIATGFHRNTVTNDEGGTDNEEFRAAAVADRVNTTWEALMGTTFACTQCHGHPYDPIKHEEYYEFMAFFNNSRDHDTYADYPWLRKLSEAQNEHLEALTNWIKKNDSQERAEEIYKFIKTWQPAYYSLQADSLSQADIYDTKYLGMRIYGIARLPQVDLTMKNNLIYRYVAWQVGGYWSVHLDAPDGQMIAKIPIREKTNGWEIEEVALEGNFTGKHDLYLRYENPRIKDADRQNIRFDWFHFTQALPASNAPDYEVYKNSFWNLLRASTKHTLIMVENPIGMQRSTHVWDRGNWLAKQQKVKAAVPDIFDPLPENAPQNRLGLARWLTDQRNPLVSRTIVNRLWEQVFGRGLVETLEDLGTQGMSPSHPELLDYLSWQLMNDYEWSIKCLLKEIVLSSTYQQDSKVSAEILEKDPMNIWYARAPRVRLNAEQIKDQTLQVSGLLSDKMYGPSVMPYQPDGVWNTPYNNDDWTLSEGEDRYRRAVYTYWKRSSPYPAMLTFDAAPRQLCSARRIRTNTPLQALVTLNDHSYMDAAIHLALKSRKSSKESLTSALISNIYEFAIGRKINAKKLATFENLYDEMLLDYQQDEASVKEMLSELEESNQNAELAALSIVANSIMNLDEFITKN
ncbi:MAG: DUF1553 domain-containing protein [Bacteroidota bacterium]